MTDDRFSQRSKVYNLYIKLKGVRFLNKKSQFESSSLSLNFGKPLPFRWKKVAAL